MDLPCTPRPPFVCAFLTCGHAADLHALLCRAAGSTRCGRRRRLRHTIPCRPCRCVAAAAVGARSNRRVQHAFTGCSSACHCRSLHAAAQQCPCLRVRRLPRHVPHTCLLLGAACLVATAEPGAGAGAGPDPRRHPAQDAALRPLHEHREVPLREQVHVCARVRRLALVPVAPPVWALYWTLPVNDVALAKKTACCAVMRPLVTCPLQC